MYIRKRTGARVLYGAETCPLSRPAPLLTCNFPACPLAIPTHRTSPHPHITQVTPVDPATLAGTTASYRAWCVEAIAGDMKEAVCR